MTTERKNATELFDRYLGRPRYESGHFHAVVDLLVAYMMENKIAPDEIRDAAFVASVKFAQLKPMDTIYVRDDLPPAPR